MSATKMDSNPQMDDHNTYYGPENDPVSFVIDLSPPVGLLGLLCLLLFINIICLSWVIYNQKRESNKYSTISMDNSLDKMNDLKEINV